MEVTCLITKSDGVTLPDTAKKVAPINNIAHSLFESVRLTINDIPISISPNNYGYKAYINNALTYSSIIKDAQMSQQGWYTDLSSHMEADNNNSGFSQRNNAFRKNFKTTEAYRPEGATFFARLLHDLVSAEAGLPPNTKVKIELQKASDEFLLMKQAADTENYKLKITNICLYIPIAQLSAAVFNELNTYMTRKIDPQPVGIHYRRTEVRPITFPKNKQEYFSDGLFTDSEMPCRICLCFVETKSKIGDMTKNPYNMKRTWTIEVDQIETTSGTSNLREKQLEEKLHNIEKQFQEFQEQQNKILQVLMSGQNEGKAKGKGKGKKSTPSTSVTQNSDFQVAVEKEAQRRLRSFIERNDPQVEEDACLIQPSAPPPPSISNWTECESQNLGSLCVGAKVTKTIYIKKVEVTLNGVPLDLVEDKESEDEAKK